MNGSQTHFNSDRTTVAPLLESMADKLIGATLIGRQGKKYRFSSSGQKPAGPKPPLVEASRMIWPTTARKRKQAEMRRPAFRRGANVKPATAAKDAAPTEWERPRCPKALSYGTPI